MFTSQGWVARTLAPCIAISSALFLALVSGCRNNPVNPFLVDNNPTYEEDAENPNAEINDPLAKSLARLKDRGEQFRDATAMATDAASGLQDDTRQLAHDALAETQRELSTSLDDAKQQGRQLATDAVVAAGATVQQASVDAQRRAIDSLEELPLDQAGPILLVTMAQGTPVAQQAAAEQLARRWPPAASYHASQAADRRAAAVAQLRDQWVAQYGQIDQAVAAARAEAARTIDDAGQLLDDATGVVQAAHQQLSDAQQIVAEYRQSNLPAAARRELAQSLERMSLEANAQARMQAAQAMGELADPVFLPALMTMLDDGPQIQAASLDSLTRVAGKDITVRADGKAMSNEEKVRLWQLWYREQQATSARR